MSRFFKVILLSVVMVLFFHGARSQTDKGKCGIEVVDVSCVQLLGYLSSYTVTFKNNTERSVDGIYYRVMFNNNEGRLISEMEDGFNSSTWTGPVGPGTTKFIMRYPNIKGASKAVILIDRVHYVNGESCR